MRALLALGVVVLFLSLAGCASVVSKFENKFNADAEKPTMPIMKPTLKPGDSWKFKYGIISNDGPVKWTGYVFRRVVSTTNCASHSNCDYSLSSITQDGELKPDTATADQLSRLTDGKYRFSDAIPFPLMEGQKGSLGAGNYEIGNLAIRKVVGGSFWSIPIVWNAGDGFAIENWYSPAVGWPIRTDVNFGNFRVVFEVAENSYLATSDEHRYVTGAKGILEDIQRTVREASQAMEAFDQGRADAGSTAKKLEETSAAMAADRLRIGDLDPPVAFERFHSSLTQAVVKLEPAYSKYATCTRFTFGCDEAARAARDGRDYLAQAENRPPPTMVEAPIEVHRTIPTPSLLAVFAVGICLTLCRPRK